MEMTARKRAVKTQRDMLTGGTPCFLQYFLYDRNRFEHRRSMKINLIIFPSRRPGYENFENVMSAENALPNLFE
jgi:hypothetical protein